MPRGVPKTVAPSGNAAGRAAFDMDMRRLAEVERLPVYGEMLARAEAKAFEQARAPKDSLGRALSPAL